MFSVSENLQFGFSFSVKYVQLMRSYLHYVNFFLSVVAKFRKFNFTLLQCLTIM